MPCFKPLQGFRSHSGKGISFNPKTGYVDLPMSVPCGQCIGCKLERARQWAVRCQHEASLHPLKCFITLTYDETNLPDNLSLVPDDLSKFWKRLRKAHPGIKIGYLACGEYGETTLRPHYHAILFGLDFPDKITYKKPRKPGDAGLFRSESLNRIWGKGMCTIGPVTFETSAYVARYSAKKVTGNAAEEHYRGRVPEFLRVSTKPAIGLRWIQKYQDETYYSDSVISRGHESKPPRFYDKQLRRNDDQEHDKIKLARRHASMEPQALSNSTPARLAVRETVARAKLNINRRSI